MYHPFKKLESAWNARTPVYLHNRTKENFLFQLALTPIVIGGIVLWQRYRDAQEDKKWTNKNFTGL